MEQVQYEAGASQASSALRSLRLAKSFWSLLILLAILVHLAAFVLVEWVGVLDADKEGKRKAGQAHTATTRTATKPVNAPRPKGEGEAEVSAMSVVKTIMEEAMPIAKLAAPMSCAILTVVLFLAVMVSVVDRSGGVGGFVSAFLWSLILLAMLTPWQDLLSGLQVFGALYDDGLTSIKCTRSLWVAGTQMSDQVLYFGRYVGYPVIALLVWLLIQCKFGGGFKRTQDLPSVSVMRPGQP